MDRVKKKELIREKIIEGALELLKERNWESLSSNDICKMAVVSKRTLYVYFQSQDDIYLELVKRSFEKLTQCIDVAFSEGASGTDKILSIGGAYLNFMINEPVAGGLIVKFDGMRFIENYPEKLEEIGIIANQYELLHIFRQLKLDPERYDRTLAVALWAHLQGTAQLIINKRMWLEEYYGDSTTCLIQEQMTMVEKNLRGLEI